MSNRPETREAGPSGEESQTLEKVRPEALALKTILHSHRNLSSFVIACDVRTGSDNGLVPQRRSRDYECQLRSWIGRVAKRLNELCGRLCARKETMLP